MFRACFIQCRNCVDLIFSVVVLAVLIASQANAELSDVWCPQVSVPPFGGEGTIDSPQRATNVDQVIGEWHGFIDLPSLRNPVAITISNECISNGGCQFAIGFRGSVQNIFETIDSGHFDSSVGSISFRARPIDDLKIMLLIDGVVYVCKESVAFIEGELELVDLTKESEKDDINVKFNFSVQRDATAIFDQITSFWKVLGKH